jgi:hypothetical protein
MKLPNYKAQAALFTLLEVYNSENLSNPNQIIENKTALLEYLTSKNVNKREVKETILEEFRNQDKDIRVLTYRVLLEKFNDKYYNLNDNQKNVLKEFINGVDSTSKLKEFYNTKINEIKVRNPIIPPDDIKEYLLDMVDEFASGNDNDYLPGTAMEFRHEGIDFEDEDDDYFFTVRDYLKGKGSITLNDGIGDLTYSTDGEDIIMNWIEPDWE